MEARAFRAGSKRLFLESTRNTSASVHTRESSGGLGLGVLPWLLGVLPVAQVLAPWEALEDETTRSSVLV